MRRKIYDVKPPKAKQKAENSFKEFFAEEPKKQPAKKAASPSRPKHKKEGISFKAYLFVGLAVLIAALGIFLYIKLQKVDIKIWPKVETLSYEQVITADKSATSVDASKFEIPAKYLEIEKSGSEDYPATGNASNEGKASGTITIFNKYSPPAPLTLKSGTHFMSDSGKLFVSKSKIVVPAAKKSGSKITASSVEVEVEAVEGGNSYNIAPSNFSIPGLKGTAWYFSITASSSKAMAGGYEGKVKKITDDDLQSAKDALTQKLVSEATSDLKSQISSDYVLIEDGLTTEIISASSNLKTGTVAEKFKYQAAVKARAIVFKKSDLEDYEKQYIISQMPEGKTLLEGSLKQEYSAKTIDISAGKIVLNNSFSSGIYQNIDRNSLSLSVLGQNSAQIDQTISSAIGENATKTEVKFWPFWTKKAPSSQKGVKIMLQF